MHIENNLESVTVIRPSSALKAAQNYKVGISNPDKKLSKVGNCNRLINQKLKLVGNHVPKGPKSEKKINLA